MLRSLAMTAAWLLPGFGMAAPAPALPHVAASLRGAGARLRIVAFGSSSTAGYGASGPAASYPAQLEQVLARHFSAAAQVSVINRGIGGEDIDDMLKRLEPDVIARKPQLVIWQIGSNDPVRNVPLERFDAEVREGVRAIRQAGIDIMLMEPQWCPTLDRIAGSDRFRDDVRRIGAELGVPVIRRSEMMHRWVDEKRLPREQMLSADGFHMTDRSYALLAREVAAEILAGAASEAPAEGTAQTAALPSTDSTIK